MGVFTVVRFLECETFDDDDDDDDTDDRMRENTASVTIIMDAKIERCVEPLFSKGGRGRRRRRTTRIKTTGKRKTFSR